MSVTIFAALCLIVGSVSLLLSAAVTSSQTATAGPLHETSVESIMKRVNDFWLQSHADPGNNKWARAVYFTGNMAHYNSSGETRYLNYAWDWAEGHNWQLNAGCDTQHADNQVAGQTYIALSAIDNNRADLSCLVNSMNDSMTWGWFEVDLGQVEAIDRVVLHPYQDRAYRYFVEVKSEQGDDYQPIVDRWENEQGGSLISDTLDTAVNGRYVRVNVVGASGYTGAWVSIEALEIFGPADPADDLAQGKAVICSSEPEPQNGCGNLVDGDTVSRWSAWFSASFSEFSPNWWWIDALYMAMPVYAMLCEREAEPDYCRAIYVRYSDTAEGRSLYDTAEQLWYRDERYIFDPGDPATQTPNGQKIFWSRGNGWVFAGHARLLAALSPNDPHWAEYVATFQGMAEALKHRQREDGFWNVSLNDPAHYPGPETSGTALITYGLAWGINNGYLARSEYESAVVKAWQAMSSVAIDPSGEVNYCQPVGSEPVPVPAENTEDFCVGAFLLAGSETDQIIAGADITISKAGQAIAASGEPITYTLTLHNNSTLSLTNVLITDTLPENAAYLGGGTLASNEVSWTAPLVGPDSSVTRHFVVSGSGTITNSDYGMSADWGFRAAGSSIVVTSFETAIEGLSAANSSPSFAGQAVFFTSTVKAGDHVSYEWDYGDGHQGTGPSSSHEYVDPGDFTAVVTATNSVSTATAFTGVIVLKVESYVYLPVIMSYADSGGAGTDSGSSPGSVAP